MSEPQGPWAYLAERAGQVRELREAYLNRQRAAREESERLERRLAAAEDLVDRAEQLRKAAGDE
jgi:hypothetical protein